MRSGNLPGLLLVTLTASAAVLKPVPLSQVDITSHQSISPVSAGSVDCFL